MAILYHGTSSRFIRDIIKNGLGVENTGKYAEIRNILSRYINPNILTDEFFDKYAEFIGSGTFSSINLRKSQLEEGTGPFGVFENDRPGSARYHAAPEYAKATTSWGAGEFEYGIVKFLNTIQQKSDGLERTDNGSTEYKNFLNLLKNHAKPEYITPDGNLNFYTDGNYETDFPILIKIDVPDSEIAGNYADDARTKKAIKPEQVVGIAFLPPFYYDGLFDFDRLVPDLKFLSKEEFLKELNKREGKRHWNEPFEIKDKKGNTSYMFLFPTDDIACVQEFFSGELGYSYFWARKGHINKGKIAKKSYEYGKAYICEFYNNESLTARVMFKSGKPDKCIFFNEHGDFCGEDKFVVGEDGKYHLVLWHNKLTKKQMFVLNYEKQPQKMSDKARTAYIKEKKEEIKSRLKDGAGILEKRIVSKENAQSVFDAHKSVERVE